MLKIGLIDDELKDLLAVISNLVVLDPQGSRLEIFPCLLSTDTESSVRKEEGRTREILKAVLATKGIAEFRFPSIEPLGPLNTTNEVHCGQILDLLSDRKADLIISDSWMWDEAAGIVLLETALSNPRWAKNGWQCWLVTKHERVAKVILDTRGQRRKFDPYARYLNKSAIIAASGSSSCDPDLERVVETTIRQIEAAAKVSGLSAFGALVGGSSVMNGPRGIYGLIEAYSKKPTAVLITGDSGTGKGVVAREIHNRSERTGKFVVLNSAAISEHLVESELFGHERGAFTGATARKEGKFVLAKKGTLFFDEIGDLPPNIQSALLTAIEERRFYRVGGNDEIEVDDVRIIAATDRPLLEMIEAGSFRSQLYYRLAILKVELPKLSERGDDISLLIEHFMRELNTRDGRELRICDDVKEKLRLHDWPGNVRELRNCLERAFALAQTDQITVEDIQLDSGRADSATSSATNNFADRSPNTGNGVNSEAARDWDLIAQGKLTRDLAEERKRLGDDNFPHFLRLLVEWLETTYGTKLPPEKVIQKMFGMKKNNFKVRLHEYQKKYGISRRETKPE